MTCSATHQLPSHYRYVEKPKRCRSLLLAARQADVAAQRVNLQCHTILHPPGSHLLTRVAQASPRHLQVHANQFSSWARCRGKAGPYWTNQHHDCHAKVEKLRRRCKLGNAALVTFQVSIATTPSRLQTARRGAHP